jgi:thiol:disulfide interchange protein
MMRKVTIIVLFLVSPVLRGQIYDPVNWSFSYEKKGDKVYELVFSAIIEAGSHIYALEVPSGGPIPTTFSFQENPAIVLDGKTYEVTEAEEKLDEAFNMKIKTFSKNAEFRQRVNIKSSPVTIKGAVNFMSCNNSTCLPPKDVEFSITINEGTQQLQGVVPVSEPEPEPEPEPKPEPVETDNNDRGLPGFFFWSFILGLVGVITPCVYPMIPMTVAFFTRGAENRSKAVMNALVFGISIVLIYTSPGIIITLTGAGAGFANALSTHWIPNIIFFLLFVVFASSFFGAFELVLPGKWASSSDARIDRGGIFSSFFMALTTVIVSFSCTGPIVGSLLVEASRGDVLRPVLGMFAFGLAFALPFTVFALFPAVLSKLPKSGGWLNSIKVVLAFLMLAFSMKFLMTIDSVYNINILSRDIYLAVWIVIFSLMGLYLMGKIRFSHDSDLPYIGPIRLILIIAVFSFVVYLIPGLFGAPLSGLSSLLPSQQTARFDIRKIATGNNSISLQTGPALQNISRTCAEPKYSDLFEMPLGLTGYFDFKQGLECAREQGKPVLIDFKGHACANCKVMEARVWSDPQVLERLSKNFVIIALYADDRTLLPENEWITSSVDGKVKKTIGKINEDLEISRFGTNALPLYVITDHEGNPLNKPMVTNLNIEEYKKWLDEGLANFRNR